MSTFKPLQRKSRATSTSVTPTSRRPRPSRSFAPAPVPTSEQASPDQQGQPTHGTRLGYSLSYIPIFPPEQIPPPASGGRPLPKTLRQKMESAFRQDFSQVRIHEGPEATSIGATAYTQGTDVYFASRAYPFESSTGQTLLGHELTHVVQQRLGRVQSPPGNAISINNDPTLERQADQVGRQAAHGTPVEMGTTQIVRYQGSMNAPIQRKVEKDDEASLRAYITQKTQVKGSFEKRWGTAIRTILLDGGRMYSLAEALKEVDNLLKKHLGGVDGVEEQAKSIREAKKGTKPQAQGTEAVTGPEAKEEVKEEPPEASLESQAQGTEAVTGPEAKEEVKEEPSPTKVERAKPNSLIANFPGITANLTGIWKSIVKDLEKRKDQLRQLNVSVIGLVEFHPSLQETKPFGVSFSSKAASFGALTSTDRLLPTVEAQLKDLPSDEKPEKDCAACKWSSADNYLGTCEIWIDPDRPNPYPLGGDTRFGSLMRSCSPCLDKLAKKNEEANQKLAEGIMPTPRKAQRTKFEGQRLFQGFVKKQ